MTSERNGAGIDGIDTSSGLEAGLGRRALLGGAAGGFALAAGGLLLPDWLAAEAAEGQGRLGGELGGRHGKNQRGRNEQRRRRRQRRREQDRRQRGRNDDDDTPRGGGLFDPFNIFVGVRFTNEQTISQRAHLTFQTYNDPGFGRPKTWDTKEHATLELEETTSYKFDVPKVRVVVDVPAVARWVEIDNPFVGFPLVTVYNQDRSREVSTRFGEGEEGVYRGGEFNDEILKIRRNKDTPGYKNFVIDVLALGYFCTTC